MRGIAPINSKSKALGIRHLGDHDTLQDLVFALTDRVPFRTWSRTGLRSRSLRNYYRGYRFTDSGQLPDVFAELFQSHADHNEYTVFIEDTPVAWYHHKLGWVAPKIGGFADEEFTQDYEKIYNAVLTITGKGPQQ